MKNFKKLAVLILSLQMIVCGAFISYAADSELDTTLKSIESTIDSYVAADKKDEADKIKEDALQTWKSLSGDSEGNLATYTFYGESLFVVPKGEAYQNALSAMDKIKNKYSNYQSDGKATSDTKNKVNKMAEMYNVPADTENASKMLSGLLPFVQLLSGILAYVTILGLTLFTSFDVAYLAFPVAKGKMESAAQSGGAMSTTSKSTGSPKFRFVTDDAIRAYDEATQENKQPWGKYLKLRAMTFILCAVVVYMLLSGNITFLINIALNALEGLFKVANNMAV